MSNTTNTKGAEDKFQELSRPFTAREVKTREQKGQKLQYIDIAATINRLNQVLGFGWSQHLEVLTFEAISPATTVGSVGGGKSGFLAAVKCTLSVADGDGFSHREGLGSFASPDPDMALKTAQAEALKKAAHQYGIALELWNEDHREQNTREQALLVKVQRYDVEKLRAGLVDKGYTAEEWTVEQVQDEAVRQIILREQGLDKSPVSQS